MDKSKLAPASIDSLPQGVLSLITKRKKQKKASVGKIKTQKSKILKNLISKSQKNVSSLMKSNLPNTKYKKIAHMKLPKIPTM